MYFFNILWGDPHRLHEVLVAQAGLLAHAPGRIFFGNPPTSPYVLGKRGPCGDAPRATAGSTGVRDIAFGRHGAGIA